jgi:hypothetical protein
MRAAEIFKKFYESEQDEVRKIRQGVPVYQVREVAREAWERLSPADRTMINIFCNAWEGRKDKTNLLGSDMTDYIAGTSVDDILNNPDMMVCIKTYLGEVDE